MPFLVFLPFFLIATGLMKWLGPLPGFFVFLVLLVAFGLWASQASKQGPPQARQERIRPRVSRAAAVPIELPQVASRSIGGLRQGPASALLIRPEHLKRILAGEKSWELRSRHTQKRERIALAMVGTGHVYGVADLVDSRGPLTAESLLKTSAFHLVDAARVNEVVAKGRKYAWVLENVQALPAPVPYKHPPGAQEWIRLDEMTTLTIAQASGA